MRRLGFAMAAVLLATVARAALAADDLPFRDVTAASGVAAGVEAHHARTPKWWLSGINLIDLDGDGHLDLFLGAHGQSAAALLNDGKGHFTYLAPNAIALIPPTEVHIAADIDEDGRADAQATHGDGGGLWYLNSPAPAAAPHNIFYRPTKIPPPRAARTR